MRKRVDITSPEYRLADLERLERDRVLAVQEQRRQARSLRDAGVSWAAIGAALGITRQAAQERFSAPRQRDRRTGG